MNNSQEMMLKNTSLKEMEFKRFAFGACEYNKHGKQRVI